MESHFEKILFMQIYTYISLIETTDYYFKIRIYVTIIFIFLNMPWFWFIKIIYYVKFRWINKSGAVA